MFDYRGLHDALFLMLYIGAGVLGYTLALVFFAIYGLYTSNMGALSREYLSQVLTVAIVAFLVWRAETLEELEADG